MNAQLTSKFSRRFLLACMLLFLSFLTACRYQQTGYASVTGIYVETSSGQHVLVRERDNTVYLLRISPHGDLDEDIFSKLTTGNKITAVTASVPEEVHDGYYAIDVYHIQLRSKNISATAAEVLPKIESIDFSAALQ